jgi:dUTP pyrophosphatase
MDLPFVMLDDELPWPARGRLEDAGIDLHARTSVELRRAEPARMVPTGIAVAVPSGYVGLVCPRSGLARNHGVTVLNAPGVVDPGFGGEIGVLLVNLSEEPYAVSRGDRIAQLLVVPAAQFALRQVDQLPSSDRADQGWGSTGA